MNSLGDTGCDCRFLLITHNVHVDQESRLGNDKRLGSRTCVIILITIREVGNKKTPLCVLARRLFNMYTCSAPISLSGASLGETDNTRNGEPSDILRHHLRLVKLSAFSWRWRFCMRRQLQTAYFFALSNARGKQRCYFLFCLGTRTPTRSGVYHPHKQLRTHSNYLKTISSGRIHHDCRERCGTSSTGVKWIKKPL